MRAFLWYGERMFKQGKRKGKDMYTNRIEFQVRAVNDEDDFTIHAPGCRDINRRDRWGHKPEVFTIEADSDYRDAQDQASRYWFADQISEATWEIENGYYSDPEATVGDLRRMYQGYFKVMPCATNVIAGVEKLSRDLGARLLPGL